MPQIKEPPKYSVTASAKPERGRYRAGFKFTREERTVQVGDKGLKMLQDDPEITIHKVEDHDPKAEKKSGSSGGLRSKDMNADPAIEAIGKMKTAEAVDAFVSENEDRKTVLEAVEERKAELKK